MIDNYDNIWEMLKYCRGESGNKTFVSQRIISRGDSIHDGVDARGVLSHYYWEQVNIS